MNTKLLIAASIILVAGVLAIATSSIGTECYNKHETFKKEKTDNFNFLVFSVVSGVFMIIAASVSSVLALRF
jgi:hypothetical protein